MMTLKAIQCKICRKGRRRPSAEPIGFLILVVLLGKPLQPRRAHPTMASAASAAAAALALDPGNTIVERYIEQRIARPCGEGLRAAIALYETYFCHVQT